MSLFTEYVMPTDMRTQKNTLLLQASIQLPTLLFFLLLDRFQFSVLPIAALYFDWSRGQPRLVHFSDRTGTIHGINQRDKAISLGNALGIQNYFHHLQTRVFVKVFIELLVCHILRKIPDKESIIIFRPVSKIGIRPHFTGCRSNMNLLFCRIGVVRRQM